MPRDRFEMVEAYLLDRMPASEREAFGRTIANDPELREDVEALRENILAIELGAFTRKLKEIAYEQDVQVLRLDTDRSRKSASTPWKLLGYAAMLAVVLAVGLWWSMRAPLEERLFSEHFMADPGLPVAMSAVDNYTFHDAMVDYKLGEHALAREKWSTLLRTDPANDTLLYFIASTHMNEGDHASAEPLYQQVAADPGSGFSHRANWYLYLIQVREDRVDPALVRELENDAMYGRRVRALEEQRDPR